MSTDIVTIDKELDDCAYEINLLGKQLAHRLLDLGKWCAKAKELLSHKRDGSFAAWVEVNCTVSLGHCYGAIRCWEKFGNCDDHKIDTRAMLLLAGNNVSDEVRESFIERAEQGEPINAAKVKAAIKPKSVADELPGDDGGTEQGSGSEASGVLGERPAPVQRSRHAEVPAASVDAAEEPAAPRQAKASGTKEPTAVNEIGERRHAVRSVVEQQTDGQPAYVRLNIRDLLLDLAEELK